MEWTLTRGKSFDGESASAAVLLIACCFGVFAWLTPNHYVPWLSFYGELGMGVAMFLACAWVLWRRRRTALRVPYLSALSFGAAFLPLVQLAAGLLVYAGDAWVGLLYVLAFALTQLVGFRASSAWGIDRTVEILQWVLLASAVASVGIAVYQWQGMGFLDLLIINTGKGNRPYGNLLQPNNLATLLVMGVVAAAYLYERKRLTAAFAAVLVFVLVVGVALTQSRAPLFETMAIGIVLFARRKRALSGRLRLRTALVGLASIWVTAALWLGLQQLQASHEGRPVAQITHAGTRTLHWVSLIDAIERKPWVGYGWNQVAVAQYVVAVDHPASHETINESHDLVLDLLVWAGLPVGLLLVAALAAWFWKTLRNVKDPSTLLTYCSIVAVFAHSMVEFPLYYANFLLPIGWFMGAVSATALPMAAFTWPRWVAPVTLVVAGGIMAMASAEYLELEANLRLLRLTQMHVGRPYRPEPSKTIVLTQLGHFWDFVITPERRGMSPGELNDMRTLTERFPAPENIVRYAAALALNQRANDAVQALRHICRMTPEDTCASMQSLWLGLGRRDPEIAKVQWPAD